MGIRDLVNTGFAATNAGNRIAGPKPSHIEAQGNIEPLPISGDETLIRNYLDVTMTPAANAASVRRAGYTVTLPRKQCDGKWGLAGNANSLVTRS
jgi:hypothetical protein